MLAEKIQDYVVTKNACKLCTPLGASLAFKGIRGSVPMLHGSQGCSTYIRRYLISHFKEPVDIACSNFAEETAIFGGGANLKIGLENIRKQYTPEFIGIATTCLSETIGDDVPMFVREYKEMYPETELPPIIHVSTPSYRGTHIDGFHAAVRETVESLASSSSFPSSGLGTTPTYSFPSWSLGTSTEKESSGLGTSTEKESSGLETKGEPPTYSFPSSGLGTSTELESSGLETTGEPPTYSFPSSSLGTSTELESSGLETTGEPPSYSFPSSSLGTSTEKESSGLETTGEPPSYSFPSSSLGTSTELETRGEHINIFPGMLSPADLRHLKEILTDFGAPFVMLPDYSQTLDGPLWEEYQRIPKGGTRVSDIRDMGKARASIEFGRILADEESAGKSLRKRFAIPCYALGLPIGLNETDRFFDALESATGKTTPEKYEEERGRLADAYVDGHKYISKARAVVYGEEDMVVGLASFLSEIGVIPVLCGSGGKSGRLKEKILEVISDASDEEVRVLDGADFITIEEHAKELKPDFFIGSSKGYSAARRLKVPLVRVGFPIHDRVGGSRILHVGYSGAQQLFDKIVNTIIERRQNESSVGYTYI